MAEEGKKYDQDKSRVDLIDPDWLEDVGRVMGFGAKKYAPNNWKIVPNAIERYEAAAFRHMSKYKQGQKIDPEFGVHHLAHAACNILFLLWFENQSLNKVKNDT